MSNQAVASEVLRVAILDDHQSIVDGYRFRLEQTGGIVIVGVAVTGEEIEPMLAAQPADVLLLDVNVPVSATDSSPYPILHTLPNLLQTYPNMAVVVISMHAESGLIKSVMRLGASGYILKEDQASIRELASIVRSVAHGDICLSAQARDIWRRRSSDAHEPLTPRQQQVLSLCAAYPNISTANLAVQLSIAPSTLRNLLSSAYLRLNVNTRAGAVAEARRRGLITPYPPAPLR